MFLKSFYGRNNSTLDNFGSFNILTILTKRLSSKQAMCVGLA